MYVGLAGFERLDLELGTKGTYLTGQFLNLLYTCVFSLNKFPRRIKIISKKLIGGDASFVFVKYRTSYFCISKKCVYICKIFFFKITSSRQHRSTV